MLNLFKVSVLLRFSSVISALQVRYRSVIHSMFIWLSSTAHSRALLHYGGVSVHQLKGNDSLYLVKGEQDSKKIHRCIEDDITQVPKEVESPFVIVRQHLEGLLSTWANTVVSFFKGTSFLTFCKTVFYWEGCERTHQTYLSEKQMVWLTPCETFGKFRNFPKVNSQRWMQKLRND